MLILSFLWACPWVLGKLQGSWSESSALGRLGLLVESSGQAAAAPGQPAAAAAESLTKSACDKQVWAAQKAAAAAVGVGGCWPSSSFGATLLLDIFLLGSSSFDKRLGWKPIKLDHCPI